MTKNCGNFPIVGEKVKKSKQKNAKASIAESNKDRKSSMQSLQSPDQRKISFESSCNDNDEELKSSKMSSPKMPSGTSARN